MVEEYLSDREQEEALRKWWRENWRWVVAGIAVGFVALGGWNMWTRHKQAQSAAAAQAYSDLRGALVSNDKDKVDALTKKLDTEFAGSVYADQAHLLIAQAHVGGGRYEMAATELKSVADKSKDETLAQIATLRLARVHIQLGQYDAALGLLDVNKAGAFAMQVHDIRGDALYAKGDVSGARAAYQAALASVQAPNAMTTPADTEYLRLKLQDIDAPVVATAAEKQ